jgi:tRNA-(ms[2]io[6]A)-hydroxylase
MDVILLDHAHCEKKAASTAIGLIFRYPEHPGFARPLSELAREELRHFEQVLTLIEKRGGSFERQYPSTYAGRLCKIIRREEPGRAVDHLLCAALIEARSCERMQLLADHLEDPELSRMYRSLLASEARHHQTYVDLAASICGLESAVARLAVIAQHEASVLAEVEKPIRLHS